MLLCCCYSCWMIVQKKCENKITHKCYWFNVNKKKKKSKFQTFLPFDMLKSSQDFLVDLSIIYVGRLKVLNCFVIAFQRIEVKMRLFKFKFRFEVVRYSKTKYQTFVGNWKAFVSLCKWAVSWGSRRELISLLHFLPFSFVMNPKQRKWIFSNVELNQQSQIYANGWKFHNFRIEIIFSALSGFKWKLS